jgi:hypothetical protein
LWEQGCHLLPSPALGGTQGTCVDGISKSVLTGTHAPMTVYVLSVFLHK